MFCCLSRQVGVLKMNSPVLRQILAKHWQEGRVAEDCFYCVLLFTSSTNAWKMMQAFIPRLAMYLSKMREIPVRIVVTFPAVHLPLIMKCFRWKSVLAVCLRHLQIINTMLSDLANDFLNDSVTDWLSDSLTHRPTNWLTDWSIGQPTERKKKTE